MLDPLEDVGIRFLLPPGQLVPVGDIGWFGVGKVLEYLAYPAECHEVPLLCPGQLGCRTVGDLDESAHLRVDSGCAFPFPLRGLLPGSDVSRLGIARVVLLDTGNPRLAKDPSMLDWQVLLLGDS